MADRRAEALPWLEQQEYVRWIEMF